MLSPSPFLRLQVLLIVFRGEIDGEKDGPDQDEGPDIGVEAERQRVV